MKGLTKHFMIIHMSPIATLCLINTPQVMRMGNLDMSRKK